MRRTSLPAILAVSFVLTTMGGTATTLAQDVPVALRFAIPDLQGRPSEPYVLAFIEEVGRRSGGSVTLEPVWNAGALTDPVFEQGVARLLVEGQVDVAMVASRGWDYVGVTSLQALQAPFLITNDALALAVSTSAIADDLLAGMEGVGVTGLALWPEDLRHPFAFEPCTDPFVSPDGFVGLTIRSIPSAVTWDLLQTLGATPLSDGAAVLCADVQGAESGLRQGFSLPRTPTATGDVVFYPKFQVLAINTVVFAQLTDGQRSVIRDAAAAVRDLAVATHPTEASAAAEWCAGGGRVVLAGAHGIAAFKVAAQPTLERLAADPTTASAIQAIEDLATTVEPDAGATACGPAVLALPSMTPRHVETMGGRPPDGTYRVDLSVDDLIAAGMPSNKASGWVGLWTMTFRGGRGGFEFVPINGLVERCEADIQLSGDLVVLVYDSEGTCAGETDSIRWWLDDEGLHLMLVAITGGVPLAEARAQYGAKPWQRIE